MPVFGFNKRKVAESAAEITRQRPEGRYTDRARPTPLMHFVCLTPSGGIPGRSGSALGSVKCDVFSIDKNDALAQILINKDPGGGPVDLQQLNADVFNISEADIPGNEYRIVHEVSGKWVVEPSGGGGGNFGYVRFKTTGKIVSRQVNAVIEYIISNQTNPGTGAPFDVGDAIVVNDSRNLFPEIEANATGTAFWYDVPDATPAPIERWEVEDCSLPINEIVVKLESCLYKTNLGPHSGRCGAVNGIADWIRSSGNNVDFPPAAELAEASQEDYVLTFSNTMRLDAITGQFVLCRRVAQGKDESDPSNDTVPKTGSATGAFWEAIKVYDNIARWICAEFTGGTWIYSNEYWEGDDPSQCMDVATRITARCIGGQCVDSGSSYVCCYDPEANLYRPVSSASALLGDPKKKDVIIGPPTISTDPQDCIDGNYCWVWPTTQMLYYECDGDPDDPTPIKQCIDGKEFYDCTDLCHYICTYCDEYATAPECKPCTDSCVFKWVSGAWTLEEDNCSTQPGCQCPGEPPITGDEVEGDTVSRPCERVPEPECNNCSYCSDLILSVAGLTWSDIEGTVTKDPNGEGIIGQGIQYGYGLVPGSVIYAGDCRWTVDIEWTGESPPGTPLQPVLDSAVIRFNGDEWFVEVEAGSPWTNDTGDWSYNTTVAGVEPCGGNFGCSDGVPGCSLAPQPGLSATLAISADPCTPAVFSITSTTVSTDMSTLGKYFYQANRDLFAGCGSCLRDVIPILDRAGENLRSDTRDKIIAMIKRKTRLFTAEQIGERLDNAKASWIDGQK